jgi:DNA-binding transcriptional regulator YhcF (GntR family)
MTVEEAIKEFIGRMTAAGISLEDTQDFLASYWPEEDEEES